jgi:hypothetical protein
VSNPINWKKGLLRLWLVLSILWGFGVAAVVFGMSQEKEELLYTTTRLQYLLIFLGACRENLGARDGQNIHKQLYLHV